MSVEGSDPQSREGKKSLKVSDSHRNDVSPLTQGLRYRAACDGQYYQDILLMRDLLPDITQYSDYFTFQQDRAPAHRAHETVELLKVETPAFIPPNLWPPNSPNLNPVATRSGVKDHQTARTGLKDKQ